LTIEVREQSELDRLFRAAYGRRLSVESRFHGFAAVAAGLNEGSVARAAIAALYLHVPELSATRRERRSRPKTGG